MGRTSLGNAYSVERFARSHTCIDSIGFGIGGGIPALFDMRRSWVKRIVSLLIEGDSFQGIFSLLDIGAGSDFIILEEDRTICISLGVYSLIECTSSFKEGFGSDVVGCLFRVEAGLH